MNGEDFDVKTYIWLSNAMISSVYPGKAYGK